MTVNTRAIARAERRWAAFIASPSALAYRLAAQAHSLVLRL
jgi:hypothetical protein